MRLAIIFLLALCVSCSNDAPKGVPDYDPEEMSAEIAKDVSMIYSDSAKIQFTIESAHLKKYKENNIAVEEFSDGFKLVFYDADERPSSSIRSNYALRKSAEGLLILKDSIVYINEHQDKLETNALTINELDKTITSTKFFRLIKASTSDTIYGRGFSAADDFSKLRVTKYLGKRQGISIDGQGASPQRQ